MSASVPGAKGALGPSDGVPIVLNVRNFAIFHLLVPILAKDRFAIDPFAKISFH